jgi:hypothetical protein
MAPPMTPAPLNCGFLDFLIHGSTLPYYYDHSLPRVQSKKIKQTLGTRSENLAVRYSVEDILI